MSRRGFAAATALIASGAFVLSACGDDGGENEITWWDTSNTAESPFFQDLVDQFMEEYPDITVKYTAKEFGKALDDFKTAAQAGTAPDVLRADIGWVPELADLGYLAALDDTDAGADFDAYLESTQASNVYDGTQYGIPQVTDALAMLYNKKMFETANITTPPATYDEFKAALATLKSANNLSAAYQMHVEGYFSQPYLYSFGGGLVDADEQKIIVNNAGSVEGWTFAQNLVKEGLAGATADLQNSYANMMTALQEGQVAVIFNGPWSLGDLSKGAATKDGNVGIAPLPVASAGITGSPIGGHDYVVYKGSKSTDAAVTFITWMNSLENQIKIADELNLIPTRTAAYDDESVKANAVITAFQPIIDGAQPRVNIPEGSQLLKPLDEQFGTVVTGGKSAQAGLDAVAAKYKDILPDYS